MTHRAQLQRRGRRAQVIQSRPASARSAVAATIGARRAMAICASVWPSGIRRAPAETRLAAITCTKACRAAVSSMPCAAQATATATQWATGRPRRSRGESVRCGWGHALQGHVQEGGALLAAFQGGFGTSAECAGEFGKLAKLRAGTLIPHGRRLPRRAPGMREQDGVDPAAAALQDRADEVQQSRSVVTAPRSTAHSMPWL